TTLPIEYPYANGNPQYPARVGSGQNPVALSDRNLSGYNESTDKNIQSSVALNYEAPFLKGLSMRAMVAYDFTSYLNKNLSKSFNLYDYDSENDQYVVQKQRDGNANISNYTSDNNRLTVQAQAAYKTQINGVHNISGVVVFEQQQTWSRWLSGLRYY